MAPSRTAPDQPHVVLVGLMGAGKSTIGRALAESLQRPFVDVDTEIEQSTGQTVRQLWITGGEAAFRQLERDTALATLERVVPVVLAAPGGVVLDPTVRDELARPDVVVVWLRGDPVALAERVRPDDHRPLLAERPAEVLAELAKVRVPLYERLADVVVDVIGRDPGAIATEVTEGVEPLGVRARRL
jgi:shikimate kinase